MRNTTDNAHAAAYYNHEPIYFFSITDYLQYSNFFNTHF